MMASLREDHKNPLHNQGNPFHASSPFSFQQIQLANNNQPPSQKRSNQPQEDRRNDQQRRQGGDGRGRSNSGRGSGRVGNGRDQNNRNDQNKGKTGPEVPGGIIASAPSFNKDKAMQLRDQQKGNKNYHTISLLQTLFFVCRV